MTSAFVPPHHRASHTTSEIYRTVKHSFIHPKPQRYKPENVWQRREHSLVVERPEDYWRAHYLRRGDNYHRGFYTLQNEVYRCMGGEVVLDAHDLVYDNLNCIDQEKVALSRKEAEIKPEVYTPMLVTDNEDLSNEALANNGRDKGRAGYKCIIDHLKITAERLKSLRAGLPYEHHVRRVEDRIRQQNEDIKPVESMVLQSTSNIENEIPVTPDIQNTPSIPDTLSTESDAAPLDKSRASTASIKTAELGSTGVDEGSRSMMTMQNAFVDRGERLKRENIEFIKAITEVIVILYNMKFKYLKSKVPLPAALLRNLKRLEGVHKKCKSARFRMHNSKRHSMETLPSSDISHLMLTDMSQRSDSPNSLPKSTRIMPSPNTFGLFSGRRFSAVAQPQEVRMETWEDLIHLDNKDKMTQNQVDAANNLRITAEMVSRTIKWSKAIRDQVVDEKGCRPPIWQVITMEKNSGGSFQEKKKPVNGKDVAMVPKKVRRELQKVKQDLQRTCESEVEQMQRQTMQYFNHKFESLNNIGFNTLFARHCSRMRDTSELIPITVAKPEIIEVLEVPPSKWFEELQIKMSNIFGTQDQDINSALMELGRFSQMGIRTVPHCRAKLCLLVMSMPAYDLCKISMQSAIKFVLEAILIGHAEEFYHWLHLRKLPLVLVR